MTLPPTLEPAAPASPLPSAPRGALSALAGNRAVLVLLVVQNLVGGLLPLAGVSIGVALAGSFLVSALVFALCFRPQLAALFASRRWRTPPAPLSVLGGLLLALVASRGAALFVASVWPQSFQGVAELSAQGPQLWALLLSAGLLVPLAEEVAFRGLLLPGYERVRAPITAALLAALVFAGAHGFVGQALVILPLAWVLIRAVQHSGSFWTGYAIHTGNNLLAVGLGSLLSGSGALDRLANSTDNVSLTTGLAGLLVALAALALATAWLRPRGLPAQPPERGPVWSGSLIPILVMVALLSLSALLVRLFPETFPGLR